MGCLVGVHLENGIPARNHQPLRVMSSNKYFLEARTRTAGVAHVRVICQAYSIDLKCVVRFLPAEAVGLHRPQHSIPGMTLCRRHRQDAYGLLCG